MARKVEKKGLGRGLSALLADTDTTNQPQANSGQTIVPIEKLVANPDQPRRHFNETDLADLTRSLKEKGILQPLIVRPDPAKSDRFQIVAGERRWRAAQRAQIHQVPVVIRDLSDTDVLEIAIIENIQRADLNPIEEAQGYRQLMDKFGHTQEKLSEALGKSRSHIANLLRLLTLPDSVQEYVVTGKLSAGHARALITSDDPAKFAKQVIDQNLSVRQTEQLVKAPPVSKGQSKSRASTKDADTRALEADLTAHLRLKVSIEHTSSGKGELRIRYSNLDELDGLCQLLSQG
ncbi:ParB family chromosome partitioning protein [Rubricella aquisinus]|uniref:ParB family chromosome partitioning protein n=1 Tax=Rubricella aquisinus TaxID=2028108 RepID=A0A840WIY7_9RHOB|nr:ParB/RepB/Spo0J family partition protein [Rubricella aquisinus]MBB5514471.1 ParB family chromosome partitioning protein [Rubricella aquisinus]